MAVFHLRFDSPASAALESTSAPPMSLIAARRRNIPTLDLHSKASESESAHPLSFFAKPVNQYARRDSNPRPTD
jgi:hypothetical protein